MQTEDGHSLQVPADIVPFITLINRSSAITSPPTSNPPILLAKVRAATLSKVMEWCQLHKDDETVLATIRSTPRAGEPAGKKLRVRLEGAERNEDDETGDEGEESEDEEEENANVEDAYASEALERDLSILPIDKKFLESLDIPALIDLTSAANYLSMDPLLDTCCKAVAKEMSGLSVEELRIKFNIQNDFTPEEEAKLKAEFGWADE